MRSIWWRLYLGVGVVALSGYPFVATGVWQDLLYVGVGLSSVVAIVLGVYANRPARPWPWYLMALGQLLWVVGDGVDSWRQDVSHQSSFPSISDGFYLSAYPVLALGLLLLIRGRRPRRDLAGLLDATIVTAGLGLLSWTLVARPTLVASEHSWFAAAVGVAYPTADILLVGLLIRLLTTPGGRTPALRLLIVAGGLLVAGDTASAALNLFTSNSSNDYDLIWLASYLAWGAAALHPSMLSLSKPTSAQDTRFTRGRLTALTLATLIAPATLAVQRTAGISLDVWAVVIGSVVLFLLVVARMHVALVQIVAANRARDQLQGDLAYQAAHDSLTQLPNRTQALTLLEAALSRAQRGGTMVGVLFVDLDGFKAVNDTYGHRAGDDVLRIVAHRMQTEVRGGDVVARLGGDEFIVLLEPLDTQLSAVDIAQRLVASAAETIVTDQGRRVRVGASIGVSISQDGAIDPERMLYEADTAVYRAKAAGKGRVEVFDNSLRQELDLQASVEAGLANALGADELEVHYQPIVEVDSGRVQSFEALVRWRRPGYGLMPPDEFIPQAELSDLICDIDTWVLKESLGQLAQWRSRTASAGQLSMAVNISGRHISQPRVLDDVRSALRSSGIPASQLILEITETVLIDDLLAIEHLTTLRELGVAISIDDFGTGYNSIARVQHLPIDIIKIDRSFLDPTRPSFLPLLRLMIQAGHTFGLPVIAEGVEHAHQLETLRSMECESAQGFHIGRPMVARDAERFVVHTNLAGLNSGN